MKNNKGITIVVLIIVIIIMLILVAVGVNYVIDDSIIIEASDTVEDSNDKIEKQEKTVNLLMNEWDRLE